MSTRSASDKGRGKRRLEVPRPIRMHPRPAHRLFVHLRACSPFSSPSSSTPPPPPSAMSAVATPAAAPAAAPAAEPKSFLELSAPDAKKQMIDFSQYAGKVVLVVNVASKCGFTPQYAGLEKLYKENKDKGLVILGFPCNAFMSQEPASEEEILGFCSNTYGVTFPIMQKVEVNGDKASPVYKFLKNQKSGVLGIKMIKVGKHTPTHTHRRSHPFSVYA